MKGLFGLGEARRPADFGDEPTGELSKEGERRWHGCADLTRPELQKTVAGAVMKGLLQPRTEVRFKRVRVGRLFESQPA